MIKWIKELWWEMASLFAKECEDQTHDSCEHNKEREYPDRCDKEDCKHYKNKGGVFWGNERLCTPYIVCIACKELHRDRDNYERKEDD